MILSPADILYRNLGIQTVVNETSKKEKFLRKKYIGVLRWESTSVRVIIIKFPVTLKRQVRNRKMKSRSSSSKTVNLSGCPSMWRNYSSLT